ncbi:MAG: hypothetical protein U5N58_00350 [Actinomycetota bacterium]|nr:hypothetical protein [Actinomycetota bacterium]
MIVLRKYRQLSSFQQASKEVGKEGARLEGEMVKKAREYGIRILGPNCLGMIILPAPLTPLFLQLYLVLEV